MVIRSTLICLVLSSCCTGAFMTKENLDENTRLIKFFCKKNKKQLSINISNQDSLIGYSIKKNDCAKIVKTTIKHNNIKTKFDLTDQNNYNPLNKYDSIIIMRLIHLTDSLGWCNDLLKSGKSLRQITKN